MKNNKHDHDTEMLAEYDFSKGVRGKYAKLYANGSNVVMIDPDIAEFFPDHDSVNTSLRSLVTIIKRQQAKRPLVRRAIRMRRRRVAVAS